MRMRSGRSAACRASTASAVFAAVRDLAAARDLPNFTAWLSAPSGPTPEEQFALCLGFLLDGIADRVSS